MNGMRLLLLFLFIFARVNCHAETMKMSPPAAQKIPKEIVTHGDRRVDDYFWLREKTNPAVLSYLNEENAYADRAMEPTRQLQEKLYQEMLGHLKEDDSSAPVKRGEFYYYSRTEKGKSYRVYCRKHRSLAAKEEVLLDANRMAEGLQFFSIGAFEPSDDNNYLAYTTDTNGYRQYTLEIKDLRSGKLLPARFQRVTSVVWSPDNRKLWFSTEHEVTKRSDEVYRAEIDSPKAEKIYFEPDELYDVAVGRSSDRQFLFVHSESKLSTEVRTLKFNAPIEPLRVLEPRSAEHKYFPDHRGGLFYIRTNDRAKNYRIVTAPDDHPGKENWTELVAHDPAVKLEEHRLFADYLVVGRRSEGLEQIAVRDLRSGAEHLIKMPEQVYSLDLDENPEYETSTVRYRYTSLVRPTSVFDYDMSAREAKLVKETEVPSYDPHLYQTERVFATASDGTKIPCSVAYKKGMGKNGRNPLFLYGYGSYGISIPPSFQYQAISLLDRGVIIAIAHVRGGGELGEPWREAGRMDRKMTTFTDFIACAEHFIREKYTDADHLVSSGGSAGGLLMGAVVNLRPDLFKAIIAHVPFVDVLNTMLDASLPLTTSEYIEWGNPTKEADYKTMKAYSPYDNVRAQKYPAMLVRVSLNDSQVPYWEGAKWVAKLRAMKTDSHPLLLKVNMGAGHGGASGRYDHLRDIAFDYGFLLWQLGLN